MYSSANDPEKPSQASRTSADVSLLLDGVFSGFSWTVWKVIQYICWALKWYLMTGPLAGARAWIIRQMSMESTLAPTDVRTSRHRCFHDNLHGPPIISLGCSNETATQSDGEKPMSTARISDGSRLRYPYHMDPDATSVTLPERDSGLLTTRLTKAPTERIPEQKQAVHTVDQTPEPPAMRDCKGSNSAVLKVDAQIIRRSASENRLFDLLIAHSQRLLESIEQGETASVSPQIADIQASLDRAHDAVSVEDQLSERYNCADLPNAVDDKGVQTSIGLETARPSEVESSTPRYADPRPGDTEDAVPFIPPLQPQGELTGVMPSSGSGALLSVPPGVPTSHNQTDAILRDDLPAVNDNQNVSAPVTAAMATADQQDAGGRTGGNSHDWTILSQPQSFSESTSVADDHQEGSEASDESEDSWVARDRAMSSSLGF